MRPESADIRKERFIVKKFKKIIALGLAAMAAVSAMSMSAFAAEQTVSYSNNLAVVSLGEKEPCSVVNNNESTRSVLESLGNAVIVYDNDECKQIITLNEYDTTYVDAEITTEGVMLKDESGMNEELVPYYFEVSDIANVTAVYYPVYVIWHYDVRLRSTPSDANTNNVIGILDNNTYFRGYSNSGNWVYGQVLNNNLAGRVGYVHNSLLNLAPDGNPYE